MHFVVKVTQLDQLRKRTQKTLKMAQPDLDSIAEKFGVDVSPEKGHITDFYVFKKHITSGGGGSIWRCMKKDTRDTAVAKVFTDGDQAYSDWRTESTVYEIIRAKGGHEHHLLNFFGAFDDHAESGDKAGYWIVIEYVKNRDLEAIWALPEYDEDYIRQIFYQVVDAMVFLGQHDLAHRDIKPSNIVVRTWNPINVALIDFNYAKARGGGQKTQFKTFLGTRFYQAPEIYLHRIGEEEAFTSKCDVWSLGVVLYELLSGGKLPDYTDVVNY